MNRYFRPVAWAWIIIIGILMFTPGGVICIACGITLTRVIGLLSIVIGVAGLVANQRAVQR